MKLSLLVTDEMVEAGCAAAWSSWPLMLADHDVALTEVPECRLLIRTALEAALTQQAQPETVVETHCGYCNKMARNSYWHKDGTALCTYKGDPNGATQAQPEMPTREMIAALRLEEPSRNSQMAEDGPRIKVWNAALDAVLALFAPKELRCGTCGYDGGFDHYSETQFHCPKCQSIGLYP